AVPAGALAARAVGLRAAGRSAVRSADAAGPAPIADLPRVDDGIATGRQVTVRAAVGGGVAVARPVVTLLARIDEAVPAPDAAGGARLPGRPVARGPEADRDALRAVRFGDDRRAVREANEASARGEPERLARLAAEIRRTAPDTAGIARLAGRHEPVPAG